jgi:hypothetical protein
MTALRSFSASIVCDVCFFLFHFINLLVIPFYLVFFVAVDPEINALNQRTYCLDVSISNLIYFVSNLLLLL